MKVQCRQCEKFVDAKNAKLVPEYVDEQGKTRHNANFCIPCFEQMVSDGIAAELCDKDTYDHDEKTGKYSLRHKRMSNHLRGHFDRVWALTMAALGGVIGFAVPVFTDLAMNWFSPFVFHSWIFIYAMIGAVVNALFCGLLGGYTDLLGGD